MPTSITSDIAAPSGQFAALVKKSWIRLPYIEPALPPTRSGVTYSPTVGMKHMKNPAITPGRLRGSDHPPEAPQRGRPEVGRGFEEGRVDPLQTGQDGQRHEWDPDVDEGDDDREPVVEQELDRLSRQPGVRAESC